MKHFFNYAQILSAYRETLYQTSSLILLNCNRGNIWKKFIIDLSIDLYHRPRISLEDSLYLVLKGVYSPINSKTKIRVEPTVSKLQHERCRTTYGFILFNKRKVRLKTSISIYSSKNKKDDDHDRSFRTTVFGIVGRDSVIHVRKSNIHIAAPRKKTLFL